MTIDCEGLSTREINRRLKEAVAAGETEVLLRSPEARHNLAVGVLAPCRVRIAGSAGYYCAGLSDGPDVEVLGSAGWGLAENLMSGRVVVHGGAGNGAAASIRGGTVVVRGDSAARAGISMKGGTLVVGGGAGYMTGFMMQKGALIICGDAGDALGDSMYEGRIFVGGSIASLGNDAVVEEPDDDDRRFLAETLAAAEVEAPRTFVKVVSGKQLYNFDKREFGRWRHAL
jgi:glutamate synthase domain-containing protein 3